MGADLIDGWFTYEHSGDDRLEPFLWVCRRLLGRCGVGFSLL